MTNGALSTCSSPYVPQRRPGRRFVVTTQEARVSKTSPHQSASSSGVVRRLATWVVAAAVAFTVAPTGAGAAPAVPQTFAPTGPGCSPVAIMAFRGSGEGSVGAQDYRGQASNGFRARRSSGCCANTPTPSTGSKGSRGCPSWVCRRTTGHDAPGVDIRFEATRLFATESRIWQGANHGVLAAVRKMGTFQQAQPAYCPITKWVLVGYSQGAMAARWTYDTIGSRVASLYLVGDPFQKPNAAGHYGSRRQRPRDAALELASHARLTRRLLREEARNGNKPVPQQRRHL